MRGNNGRFIRNNDNRIIEELRFFANIAYFLFRCWPLLMIIIYIYFQYNLTDIVKEFIIKMVCGKDLKFCPCSCQKDGNNNGYIGGWS